MHHLNVDQWSRGESFLHRRDARMKLVALMSYLICVATAPAVSLEEIFWYAAFPVAGIAAAGLPIGALALRAALVLPFAATFSALSLLAGDASRAIALPSKSVLSALGVMLVVATTPMPKLLRGAEGLGAPRLMTLVIQFLFRYLFLLSETAQHMRMAAACRGGLRRDAAAGAVAVLFGASYQRAEGINRSMLARGFHGQVLTLDQHKLGAADVLFAGSVAAVLIAGRLSWGL